MLTIVLCSNKIRKNTKTFGKKINIPATVAPIAQAKTPPAAISLARPAASLYLGLTISTIISIAVLTHSITITSPNKIKQVIHSQIAILKN